VRIRSRHLDKLVGIVGASLAVGWRSTLDVRIRATMPELNPYDPRHRGEFIYASWHETILAFAFIGMPALYKTRVLISQHQDGEYITQIVRRLGARVVRGSTTRGGRAGLLEMAHGATGWHLAITPDGPRGPRRRLQGGAIILASRTGLPIVPMGFGFSNAWRARSWDRFAIPMPFSLMWCVAGPPIHVPSQLSATAQERWRSIVEQAMLQATESAELAAAGGPAPRAPRLAA
jgi:lysophospholipid acyltransferase (LPLAT)-like uncharacterized protein